MVLEHKGLALSDWKWAERPDKMPQGLLDAARADLRAVYTALELELADRDFISGTLSVADIALLQHLASAKAVEVEFSDVLAGAAHAGAAQA
jgi:glutathione S-transferase